MGRGFAKGLGARGRAVPQRRPSVRVGLHAAAGLGFRLTRSPFRPSGVCHLLPVPHESRARPGSLLGSQEPPGVPGT